MVEVAVYWKGEAVFPFGTPVEALGFGPRLRKRLGEGSYLVHLLPGGALEAFRATLQEVWRRFGRLLARQEGAGPPKVDLVVGVEVVKAQRAKTMAPQDVLKSRPPAK